MERTFRVGAEQLRPFRGNVTARAWQGRGTHITARRSLTALRGGGGGTSDSEGQLSESEREHEPHEKFSIAAYANPEVFIGDEDWLSLYWAKSEEEVSRNGLARTAIEPVQNEALCFLMQELKRHQDQRGKVDANEVLEAVWEAHFKQIALEYKDRGLMEPLVKHEILEKLRNPFPFFRAENHTESQLNLAATVATLQAMELAYRDWANLLAENAEAAYGADRAAKTVAWNAYIQPALVPWEDMGTTDTNVREDITDRFEEWNEDGTLERAFGACGEEYPTEDELGEPLTLQIVLEGVEKIVSPDGSELSVASLQGRHVGLLFVDDHNASLDLIPVLEGICAKVPDFEVVAAMMRSDSRHPKTYDEFRRRVPFGTLAFGDRAHSQAASACLVAFLPTLVLFGPDGTVLNWNACSYVHEDPEGRGFPWQAPAMRLRPHIAKGRRVAVVDREIEEWEDERTSRSAGPAVAAYHAERRYSTLNIGGNWVPRRIPTQEDLNDFDKNKLEQQQCSMSARRLRMQNTKKRRAVLQTRIPPQEVRVKRRRRAAKSASAPSAAEPTPDLAADKTIGE